MPLCGKTRDIWWLLESGYRVVGAELSRVAVEQLFHARNGVYVLRVRGDSMIDDHLCDGDYVVIERRENARNGEQVVALLDTGEATLKRFYREGRRIRLQPANKTMEPRFVEAGQCKVQGVVIGVLRSYQA